MILMKQAYGQSPGAPAPPATVPDEGFGLFYRVYTTIFLVGAGLAMLKNVLPFGGGHCVIGPSMLGVWYFLGPSISSLVATGFVVHRHRTEHTHQSTWNAIEDCAMKSFHATILSGFAAIALTVIVFFVGVLWAKF